MDLPYKFVWFAGDSRARLEPFAVREIFPAFPQAGEDEWRIVLHADRVRNFTAGNFFPFVREALGKL